VCTTYSTTNAANTVNLGASGGSSGSAAAAFGAGVKSLIDGDYGNLSQSAYNNGNYVAAVGWSVAADVYIAGNFITAGLEGTIARGLDALTSEASGAISRGLSGFGGIFSSETNAVGGTVWTSVGDIGQKDVGTIVNGAMYQGDVNILTGVHGFADGTMITDLSLYTSDVKEFGSYPGVNVYNVPTMTSTQIQNLLNSPATTIGAFCNSGICLKF
jgi:hypothetical protein